MHKVNEIRSVIIPLETHRLLMANACVAEVISYYAPQLTEDNSLDADWFHGEISWRNYKVPVILFENLCGIERTDKTRHRSRIIICNLPSMDDAVPYIGIVAESIPRLARVTEKNVVGIDSPLSESSAVSSVVILNDLEAIVPDLTFLRDKLKELPEPETLQLS